MRHMLPFSLVFFLSIWSFGALAQGTSADEAEKHFQNGDWQKAAQAYQALVQKDQSNATYWYRLGYSRHLLKDYRKAVEAYERAQSLSSSINTMYNLACTHALLNQKKPALKWLNDAAKAGFNRPDLLLSDNDLHNIRSEPEFEKIVSLAKTNAAPCEYDPVHRQFDFWVGEWNVQNARGQNAGTSSIQKILGGCVIYENWTGANGYEGKSFNFVDPLSGKWRQAWVDNKGGKIEFTGQLEEKNMVFHVDVEEKDGSRFHRRLTFFPQGPDRVRQYSERTTDDGKTWNVEYDFTYVRKGSGAE